MDEILKINMAMFAKLLCEYRTASAVTQQVIALKANEVVDPETPADDRDVALTTLVELLLH